MRYFLSTDSSETSKGELAYADFLAWLTMLMPPKFVLRIRIEGLFNQIKTRSVSRQEHYRPLVEATKGQSESHFSIFPAAWLAFLHRFLWLP